MINFHQHKTKITILVTVFLIAWAVWTFILLPMSETPNLPDPAAPQATPQP